MKTEEKKRKEEGPKKESPCLAFCGTQATDEMMAKCRQAMSKAADGDPLIKQQTQTRRTGK